MMHNERAPREPAADFTTAILTRVGVDRFAECESVVGPMFVGWSARGVAGVRPAAGYDAAAFARWYAEHVGRRVVRAIETDAIVDAAAAKLIDPASAAAVPVDLSGLAPAARRVHEEAARIGFGYARPAELVAADVGDACTAQTVGDVLARTPLPMLVPSHRVVSVDRCCHPDYVLGVDVQHRLLAAEGLDPHRVDGVIERGFRYIENDGWFCLPTCGEIATHIDAPGYRGLRTIDEVRLRGLRACESCRPLAA